MCYLTRDAKRTDVISYWFSWVYDMGRYDTITEYKKNILHHGCCKQRIYNKILAFDWIFEYDHQPRLKSAMLSGDVAGKNQEVLAYEIISIITTAILMND